MLIVLVVGYMVFMLPANLGMRIIGPPRQLGIAVIFFGACGTCLSASKNYGTIMGLRVLIGMGEAFVQVGLLYFSFWYVIFTEFRLPHPYVLRGVSTLQACLKRGNTPERCSNTQISCKLGFADSEIFRYKRDEVATRAGR
jgi:hypothetical protein